jgi:hypothetical protein
VRPLTHDVRRCIGRQTVPSRRQHRRRNRSAPGSFRPPDFAKLPLPRSLSDRRGHPRHHASHPAEAGLLTSHSLASTHRDSFSLLVPYIHGTDFSHAVGTTYILLRPSAPSDASRYPIALSSSANSQPRFQLVSLRRISSTGLPTLMGFAPRTGHPAPHGPVPGDSVSVTASITRAFIREATPPSQGRSEMAFHARGVEIFLEIPSMSRQTDAVPSYGAFATMASWDDPASRVHDHVRCILDRGLLTTVAAPHLAARRSITRWPLRRDLWL